MTEKQIDRVLAATDRACKAIGFSRFEDAAAEGAQFLIRLAALVSRLKTRNTTRKWVRSLPDLTPSEFEEMMQLLSDLPYRMRRIAPQLIKLIPHAPGGRPSTLTAELRQQICKQVGELILKHVPLSAAYERLGQRHGISARTIQRIWNEPQIES
jgi:hypothetical protein